jgi:hypothetical protein
VRRHAGQWGHLDQHLGTAQSQKEPGIWEVDAANLERMAVFRQPNLTSNPMAIFG